MNPNAKKEEILHRHIIVLLSQNILRILFSVVFQFSFTPFWSARDTKTFRKTLKFNQ